MIASNAARRPVANPATPLAWCADRGDGTYRNPVLYADYSDPDVVRVGDDYWLTASSFCHVPGLPILHSRDLVNWTLVNHALPQLVPADHFAVPRHGGGVWAPSIRHHAGKFRLYYPDPDFGLYVVTADDPRGAWSAPVLVKAGKGLIDPCPLWDDDGAGWLIHGWAKSRAGIKNRLTLHRLGGDHASVTDAGEVVIDADKIPGWHTLEGPKFYKRNGWYYVFAPAGGVRDGYQAVFRARDIRGPYAHRIVLAQGRTPINGPHQGGWVSTPAGDGWFLHFQDQGAYGRIVHLQPVRWEDDWPVMGDNGEPVLEHRKPVDGVTSPVAPATSDPFETKTLGAQWQWQANPQAGWAAFAPKPGLRLACVPQPPAQTLWHAGHLLLQKFPAPEFVATTELRLAATADGDRAGLVVFGHDYAWLGLRREHGALRLVLRVCAAAHEGGAEREEAALDFAGDAVQLRVSVGTGAQCRFAWSADGREFHPLGPAFAARASYWVGAKVGLFASGAPAGHADVSWFRVTP